MAAQHDPQDRLADVNLRRIGAALPLPEPTSAQRRGWKIASSEARSEQITFPRRSIGGLSVRARRYLTFSFSAVAAAVLLVAFAFVPPKGSMVQAATILRSFRDSVHRGFKMEISNLRVEGVQADFRLLARFAQPITLAQLADDTGGTQLEPDAFYLDGAVHLSEDNADAPGLNAEIAMAIREQDKWLFCRLANVPRDEIDAETDETSRQIVRRVLERLESGILVDLTALESMLHDLGADSDFALSALNVQPCGDDAHPSIEINVGGSSNPTTTTTNSPSQSIFDFKAFGAQFHQAFDEARDEAERELASSPSDWDRQIHDLIGALVTGRATQEQLESLIHQLESVAGHATVTQDDSGVWTLHARDFDVSGADADEREMIEHASLTIRYRDGEGVLSAALEGLGQANGRLTFEFIDDIDASLLERQRFIDRGIPMLDLRNPWQMMTLFSDVISGDPSDDE